MKELNYKITWKSFEYINELADYFDQNRECELISVSLGKNSDCFLAVFKDYRNYDNETKIQQS